MNEDYDGGVSPNDFCDQCGFDLVSCECYDRDEYAREAAIERGEMDP